MQNLSQPITRCRFVSNRVDLFIGLVQRVPGVVSTLMCVLGHPHKEASQ